MNTVTKLVEISFTPEELGRYFSQLDSDEMARFFVELSGMMPSFEFSNQMSQVVLSSYMTDGAKRTMKLIGGREKGIYWTREKIKELADKNNLVGYFINGVLADIHKINKQLTEQEVIDIIYLNTPF